MPPSRSPHGERGLKFDHAAQLGEDVPSLPSRGAWIEIFTYKEKAGGDGVAPLTGSVD